MPNPGIFKGERLKFMESKQEGYTKATRDNCQKEYVADTQRQFHKRFLLSLSWDDEPTAAFLATVNDTGPDIYEEAEDDDDGDGDAALEYGKIGVRATLTLRNGVRVFNSIL